MNKTIMENMIKAKTEVTRKEPSYFISAPFGNYIKPAGIIPDTVTCT